MKSSATSPPENRLKVRAAQAANRLFCRAYHRVTTLAPSHLPLKGPAILVCNHVSGLDPLLIQSACKRLIVWMMAKEYYQMKSLTWLYEIVEAIPVQRSGNDLSATRAAMRALANNRVLGVFPEGRIETGPQLLPFQTGVALMAIKTGVPVYPAYLDGTQRGRPMIQAVAHPQNVVIRFGAPLTFPPQSATKDVLEAATQSIKQAVWALKTGANPTNCD